MQQTTTVLQDAASTPFVYGLGPAMQTLNDMVGEVARTDIPVLVLGESGTGKDAYARLIHRLSPRNDRRFQKLNCASLDSALLPSQFGQARENRLPAGQPGTLYLDNIQEMDPAGQRALLSCLPDGEDAGFNSGLGVRIISSAASALEPEVELGRFRRELYFRLNAACLRIPPLRERRSDISALAGHFLNKHAAALNRPAPHLDDETMSALAAYHWPGNIRELENSIRKAVLFGDFQIVLRELPVGPQESTVVVTAHGSSLKIAARAASKKAERELILQALERTHWNRKRAARDLQISYKSLLYKIKQIGVSNGKNEG